MSLPEKRAYRCLYNHEMLILFTSQSPYQSYAENVSAAQVEGFVRELEGTQVDALMCCPQAWMTPLWFSEVDPKWREARDEVEPLPEMDWKYYDKAYYRARRYMLQGEDPVALTLRTARQIGLGVFLSYRMNEIHYVAYPDCPTHSRFWREHPEYRIHPGAAPLNYLVPEVRERYFAILSELVHGYDIDGLELDFMRHNLFFPHDGIESGREVMNDFVRRIRRLLDETGGQHHKAIQLCARVSRTLALCADVGLDPVAWDREGLIDMVNVSPHFRYTTELDVEGYRQSLTRARVYGEMSHVTHSGATSGGYTNNINRRVTRELYETGALSFWDRGVDGISFFNFAYTRDHGFAEPRRTEYPGEEPPFAALKRICDVDYLRARPKHYALTLGHGSLPVTLPSGRSAEVRVYVADRLEAGHGFREAVLRLETDRSCGGYPLDVAVNGRTLDRFPDSGELFRPLSQEGLPRYDDLAYFIVPLECLRHGHNAVSLGNRRIGEGAYVKRKLTPGGSRLTPLH